MKIFTRLALIVLFGAGLVYAFMLSVQWQQEHLEHEKQKSVNEALKSVAGHPASQEELLAGHVYVVEFSKASERSNETNYYAVLLELKVGASDISNLLPQEYGIYCKVSTNLLVGRTYKVIKTSDTNSPGVVFENVRL